MNVTVLGAGSWGTTVATLTTALNPTVLWARNPDVAAEINADHTNAAYLPSVTLPRRLRATAELEEAVRDADVLIVGVPSSGFRATIEDARKWIRPWIPVVSLTKGIEPGTLLRMTQILEELLPGHPAAALTGPNLAREIMAGQAAASVIATYDMGVAAALQSVLRHKLFRVYRNHDVVGCEIGGALKNVIAIAAGIGEGLGVGDNTRAGVITRGLAELTRLGTAMGAEPQTLAGLAGMGDLMATCMSPYSRNRTVGELLGRGPDRSKRSWPPCTWWRRASARRAWPWRWRSGTRWSCRSARRSTRWSWVCSDRSMPTGACVPPATRPTRTEAGEPRPRRRRPVMAGRRSGKAAPGRRGRCGLAVSLRQVGRSATWAASLRMRTADREHGHRHGRARALAGPEPHVEDGLETEGGENDLMAGLPAALARDQVGGDRRLQLHGHQGGHRRRHPVEHHQPAPCDAQHDPGQHRESRRPRGRPAGRQGSAATRGARPSPRRR